MTLRLPRTTKALLAYDRTQPERDRMLANIRTAADAEQWMQADKTAITALREAFAEDTKDRNSHDHAMLADLSFIRRMVERGIHDDI